MSKFKKKAPADRCVCGCRRIHERWEQCQSYLERLERQEERRQAARRGLPAKLKAMGRQA